MHDKWLGGSHVVQPIKKERAGHKGYDNGDVMQLFKEKLDKERT